MAAEGSNPIPGFSWDQFEQVRQLEEEKQELKLRLEDAEDELERLRPLEELNPGDLIAAPIQQVRLLQGCLT